MKKQNTVAAFVRVSTDDQNDDLQRDALSKWAQAKGVELARIIHCLVVTISDRRFDAAGTDLCPRRGGRAHKTPFPP